MFILESWAECKIGGADISTFMAVFKLVITVVQYAVPVALILWGSIDLFKSITSGKDDDIKKKQTLLFKKVLSAVIIFLLPWLVFSVLSLLGVQFGKCYNTASPGLPSLNDSGYNSGDINKNNNSKR